MVVMMEDEKSYQNFSHTTTKVPEGLLFMLAPFLPVANVQMRLAHKISAFFVPLLMEACKIYLLWRVAGAANIQRTGQTQDF